MTIWVTACASVFLLIGLPAILPSPSRSLPSMASWSVQQQDAAGEQQADDRQQLGGDQGEQDAQDGGGEDADKDRLAPLLPGQAGSGKADHDRIVPGEDKVDHDYGKEGLDGFGREEIHEVPGCSSRSGERPNKRLTILNSRRFSSVPKRLRTGLTET
jgi:hypothetical protein